MNKTNIFPILMDHLATLRDYRSGKLSLSDWVIFIGSPMLFGVLGWCAGGVKVDVLNGLLSAFSIFAGLLLNLLMLVYGIAQNSANTATSSDQSYPARRQYLREILANISFSIVSSIGIAGMCLIALFLIGTERYKAANYTSPWITAAIAYLTVNFMLTLLQIIKRVYTLLLKEFERTVLKKTA